MCRTRLSSIESQPKKVVVVVAGGVVSVIFVVVIIVDQKILTLKFGQNSSLVEIESVIPQMYL